MKHVLCLFFVLVCALPRVHAIYGYYLIIQAGGMVQDTGKIQQLREMYTENVNKLNLLSALQGEARQSLIQWQAMEQTFGDGSGIIAYIPDTATGYSQDTKTAIDAYAQQLPATLQGAQLREYLKRQTEQSQRLAAYKVRLAACARANGQDTLSLSQLAAISNELNGLSQDDQLQQITADAESNSVRAIQQDAQIKLREYMALRREAEAAASTQR